MFTSGNNNIRMNTNTHKFFYRMLRRFRLEFIRTTDVRHKTNMNKKTISSANFKSKLTNSFQERLTFNITRSSTNFHNAHIRSSKISILQNKLFYFVSYMRNNLNSLTKIFAFSLFIQNFPVNAT